MEDIVKYAMQMERDGQEFYQKAAAEAKQPELKEIFTYLADEEERHYQFFKRLVDGDIETAAEALKKDTSLENTRNVFVRLIRDNTGTHFGEDARSAWKQALEIEQKSVKLYSDQADKTNDPKRKTLFNKIADEERNHVYLIDNMLSFMTDPKTFADSQQFASFQSWEGH